MEKYEGRYVRPANPGSAYSDPGFLHYYEGSRDMPAGWYVTPGWQSFCRMARWLDDPEPTRYVADERGIRWGTRWLDDPAEAYIYVWGDDPAYPCTDECPAAHYENRYNISRHWACRLAGPRLHQIGPGQHHCVVIPDQAVMDRVKRDLVAAESKAVAAIAQRDRLAAIKAMLASRRESP